MRMKRPFILATAAALAALFCAAAIAEAQPRQRRGEPARPLTVQKRSFLDSGKVVPVGTESHYVRDIFDLQRSPDYYYARGRYGGETLPGRFGVFGN